MHFLQRTRRCFVRFPSRVNSFRIARCYGRFTLIVMEVKDVKDPDIWYPDFSVLPDGGRREVHPPDIPPDSSEFAPKQE